MTRNLPLRIGWTIVVLGLGALHLLLPARSVDSITVVLLVIAVLPWAQPLIKSIELLGVKVELQDLKDRLADVEGATASANRQAQLALATTGPAAPAQAPAVTNASSDDTLRALAEEYNVIRRDQRSGDARTTAMTAVVRKMIDLVPNLGSFDIATELRSDDRGRRLAAYAVLYARPDATFLSDLVQSVAKREDKPFGQYWGLQAVSRVIATAGNNIPPAVVEQLRACAENLPRGTDRAYVLRRILEGIGGSRVRD